VLFCLQVGETWPGFYSFACNRITKEYGDIYSLMHSMQEIFGTPHGKGRFWI